MGTTLVVASIFGSTLRVANVGDSRLYVIGEDITQITRDHSLVEEMVQLGQIDRKAARTHEKKNYITRQSVDVRLWRQKCFQWILTIMILFLCAQMGLLICLKIQRYFTLSKKALILKQQLTALLKRLIIMVAKIIYQ